MMLYLRKKRRQFVWQLRNRKHRGMNSTSSQVLAALDRTNKEGTSREDKTNNVGR